MKFFLTILLLFGCFFLQAKEEEEASQSIPKGTIHQGDYFAAGGTIKISGVVTGNVFVFGSQVLVDGKIGGDLVAAGGSLNIAGEVGKNARLMGGQVQLNGIIHGNATVVGGNIELFSQAQIKGKASLTGSVVNVGGHIEKNLTLRASDSFFSGTIGGNVKAHTNHLHLGPQAQIEGDLQYTGEEEALIEEGGKVGGIKSYQTSSAARFFHGEGKKVVLFFSHFMALFMNFLFSFVVGIIFLKGLSHRLKIILEVFQKKPWKAFWTGLLATILLPIVCLILFITILGLPFALALIGFSVLTFYSAKVFPIIWISNWISPKVRLRKNTIWVFFLGLVLFFLIIEIPFVGGVISLMTTFLGIGALVLERFHKP